VSLTEFKATVRFVLAQSHSRHDSRETSSCTHNEYHCITWAYCIFMSLEWQHLMNI